MVAIAQQNLSLKKARRPQSPCRVKWMM